MDENHLKCDCIEGSIVNGVREPFSYSFAIDKPPDHKINKALRIKLFKEIKKSVLPHVTFYLEDDKYKPINLKGETISFTCELVKNSFVLLNEPRPGST